MSALTSLSSAVWICPLPPLLHKCHQVLHYSLLSVGVVSQLVESALSWGVRVGDPLAGLEWGCLFLVGVQQRNTMGSPHRSLVGNALDGSSQECASCLYTRESITSTSVAVSEPIKGCAPTYVTAGSSQYLGFKSGNMADSSCNSNITCHTIMCSACAGRALLLHF